MLTLTFPLLALPLLWTILPATSLSVQSGIWDDPSCTKGMVSVSRGERAVMACNISNDFRGVVIYLGAHRKGQPLFHVRRPGYFSRAGWHLHVQGGTAQLVIDDANDTQAGCYTWHLQGRQRNVRVTMLNVSDPDMDTPHLPRARDQLNVVVVVISVIVFLALLLVSMSTCTKSIFPRPYAFWKYEAPRV
uniref:Secreted and transmembrane 1 n=1 Tax=Canis lupus familiaris TaxID=9615 RepID=A0A8C0NV25_CANLF